MSSLALEDSIEREIVEVTAENKLETENDKPRLPSASSGERKEVSSKEGGQEDVVLSIDDLVKNSLLPDLIEDADFNDKLKVFNNYRNFGAMYLAKKNFKKVEHFILVASNEH